MITAEHSGAISKTDNKNSQGSLPHKHGSYYSEFVVMNYLNEPIYAVDFRNHKQLIPRHPQMMQGQRKIIIQSRGHAGMRSYDKHTSLENTPCNHEEISIPYEILRDEPVFVEEINAVLCFAEHLAFVKHPHSESARADHDQRIKLEAQKPEAPFVLVVNDPTGRLHEVCIEINGTVCATAVTHFADEADTVVLGLRNKTYSRQEFTKYCTTLTELMTQDPRVWSLGGFRLSSSREWFEQVLEIERNKAPVVIDVGEVSALRKKDREEDAERIKQLGEDNKELRRRLTALEATNDALKSGDYHDKAADLAYRKLQLEHEKLRQSQSEAALNLAAEKLKTRKEVIALLGVVAKTLAVVVPIGFGLYKAICAVKAT